MQQSPLPPVTEVAAHLAEHSASDAAAHQVHEAYVSAVNSNDLETLLDILTEDVVFQVPNEKPYVGKAALTPWLEGYIANYRTHWEKPVQEFIVDGAWAFERYSFISTDTPIAGGKPFLSTGWGLVIYHRDADGKWRVARDARGEPPRVSWRPLGLSQAATAVT